MLLHVYIHIMPTVRHPASVKYWNEKKCRRWRNQYGIGIKNPVGYRTEMSDAGMPMMAASALTPMSRYASTVHNTFHLMPRRWQKSVLLFFLTYLKKGVVRKRSLTQSTHPRAAGRVAQFYNNNDILRLRCQATFKIGNKIILLVFCVTVRQKIFWKI